MRSSVDIQFSVCLIRIIPEPSFPSQGSQARGTRLQTKQMQSRTQSMPVRRLGAGHDSGETEYRISNFGYPVSCAHAQAQTATLNSRGRH